MFNFRLFVLKTLYVLWITCFKTIQKELTKSMWFKILRNLLNKHFENETFQKHISFKYLYFDEWDYWRRCTLQPRINTRAINRKIAQLAKTLTDAYNCFYVFRFIKLFWWAHISSKNKKECYLSFLWLPESLNSTEVFNVTYKWLKKSKKKPEK